MIAVERPKPSDVPGMGHLLTEVAVRSYIRLVSGNAVLEKELRGHFARRADGLSGLLDSYWVVRRGPSSGIAGMGGFNPGRRLIHSVYVDETERGTGIGTALMRHIISWAGSGPIYVLVAARNHGAISLYRRLGFDETGRKVSWDLPSGSIAEVEMRFR